MGVLCMYGQHDRERDPHTDSRVRGVHFVCFSELMKSLRLGECICGGSGRETQQDGERADPGIERTGGREERWEKKGY